MQRLADLIDLVIRRIGGAMVWLVLIMVFLQFSVVIFRYAFGVNSIEIQESITILHGLIFMIAAAYVLQLDKHVRVDIFYGDRSLLVKTIINMFGVIFFLFPMTLIVWNYSWPYVGESWAVFEGSADAGGLRVRYLQKSAILIFAGLMALQGVSILLRGLLDIRAGELNNDR